MPRTLTIPCISMICVAGAAVAHAATPMPVADLTITGIYASHAADATVYCLLGNEGCLIPQDPGTADIFIARWLSNHPGATATPVAEARLAAFMHHTRMPRDVFLWVEDKEDSLTISLVREGFYPASAFRDIVALDQAMKAAFAAAGGAVGSPPGDVKTGFPTEEPPLRLVSDEVYADRTRQLTEAEAEAKRLQRGIWSDQKRSDTASIPSAQRGARVIPLNELYVRAIYAHRLADSGSYCLLGGKSCELGLPFSSIAPGEAEFVQHWLATHPHANGVPISEADYKRRRLGPLLHSTYFWIEDGRESLNLELIRNGFYFARGLEDMVADDQQRMAALNDPRMRMFADQMRRERAETGAPQRLVSEAAYAERMRRAVAAEKEAEREKRGLWSDALMPLWRPPSDDQLIAKYRQQKAIFDDLATMIGKNERLALVNWEPWTAMAAVNAGVPRFDVDAFVTLLKQLGVNEKLTGCPGVGKFCLNTTDITAGMFDSGVIMGYVYSPTDLAPLASDLERNAAVNSAGTAYRRIEGDWYLFRLEH